MVGFIGVFVIDGYDLGAFFGLYCEEELQEFAVWKDPENILGEMFSVLHVVLIVMYSTLQYIVFYILPYKFDRIKKTTKEVYSFTLLLRWRLIRKRKNNRHLKRS